MSKIEILKCNKCSKYTLKKTCDICSSQTLSTKPAKYSPEDPYGRWRLKYKKKHGI
ncbi:nucleolar RNA-binding Nop10p family protein [Candidatus Woesearchaeota archaeon]|nr:nucleolar RNA-binding Nop10p family protein [Candidatus Woesearchaeota archaeon]